MNLLIGALSIGLVLSLLGLGVYISYRILDTFDLTVDGSFAFGAVVAGVLLTRGVASFWASAAGFVAGMAAGALSGMIHQRLGVSRLLSGLLVATALYSLDLLIMGGGDISLASTRTLPTQAFALWQWFGGPESGATIFGTEVSARTLSTFLAMLPAVGTAVFLVDRFFRTKLGLAMRATGDNAQMARSMGIDDAMVFIAGLAVSNGLVGLSGALFAQYQGFVTIQMSIGNLVTGLAAVAIDEGLLRGRSMSARIARRGAGIHPAATGGGGGDRGGAAGQHAQAGDRVTGADRADRARPDPSPPAFPGGRQWLSPGRARATRAMTSSMAFRHAGPPPPTLEVHNLNQTFERGTANEVRALIDVSLTLAPGDFVTVVGMNGSGKSTLLNLVAGAFRPDSGTITLDGVDVTQQEEFTSGPGTSGACSRIRSRARPRTSPSPRTSRWRSIVSEARSRFAGRSPRRGGKSCGSGCARSSWDSRTGSTRRWERCRAASGRR